MSDQISIPSVDAAEQGVRGPPQAQHRFHAALESAHAIAVSTPPARCGRHDHHRAPNPHRPAAKGAHRRRKRGPGPPARKLPGQNPAPGAWLCVAAARLEMHLNREQRCDCRPGIRRRSALAFIILIVAW